MMPIMTEKRLGACCRLDNGAETQDPHPLPATIIVPAKTTDGDALDGTMISVEPYGDANLGS